ncbi:MAG TPA: cupin domain-containing protein, partial [Thermoanaerobaculia bacterium]|nr:cupin domain-containing protein [Thermoanaerobaculia bacterium]
MTAEEVIELLQLAPHPEGGFYRQTFRGLAIDEDRFASTAIYYLLQEGKVSAWHRVVDADEVWHFYAGAPVELTVADGPKRSTMLLGADLAAGQRPQGVVP